MDIDLLSRMVAELIVTHDQVGLPGVGTFVAEMVPATFSDKGFTINPPYRRLSFYPSRLEDTLLIDLYAESNQISREAASTYITQYLAELKSVLEQRKSIVLPGLGRLRATRENTLFFVQDEGLDIFPAGVGLEPVSLKSRIIEEEEPVVIEVPLPAVQEEEPAVEPEGDSPVEPANEEEEPANEEPAGEEAGRPHEPLRFHTPPEWIREESWREPKPRRDLPWWATFLIVTAILAVIGLLVFMALARLAPDFIDSILYTPDELRIINY